VLLTHVHCCSLLNWSGFGCCQNEADSSAKNELGFTEDDDEETNEGTKRAFHFVRGTARCAQLKFCV
jgi:hypothetical protein